MMTPIPFALAALLAALPARAAEAHGHAHPPPADAHAGHGGDHHAAPAAGDAARIPEPMREEHAEIHAALVRATKLKGRVGDSARALAQVLHPHFVREEEIALPPLGLLRPLATGGATPGMREVLPMTDALEAELPRMLEEHGRIGAAAKRLEEIARAERNAQVEELARTLQLHARTEEEVFYPAAVLVGRLVRQAR